MKPETWAPKGLLARREKKEQVKEIPKESGDTLEGGKGTYQEKKILQPGKSSWGKKWGEGPQKGKTRRQKEKKCSGKGKKGTPGEEGPSYQEGPWPWSSKISTKKEEHGLIKKVDEPGRREKNHRRTNLTS